MNRGPKLGDAASLYVGLVVSTIGSKIPPARWASRTQHKDLHMFDVCL